MCFVNIWVTRCDKVYVIGYLVKYECYGVFGMMCFLRGGYC